MCLLSRSRRCCALRAITTLCKYHASSRYQQCYNVAQYIIKATHAHPVPTHPYSLVTPSSPTFRESRGHDQALPDIIHSSPFIPVRLPIFDLVITIDNLVVRLLSVGSPSRKGVHTGSVTGMEKWSLPGDVDVATNVEEGNNFPETTGRRVKLNRKLD